MDRWNDGDDDKADLGWIAVPLTALLIPILAISIGNDGGTPVVWAVAAILPLIALVIAARSLLNLRHQHRLEELQLQAEISSSEAAQLAEANRVIERNSSRRDAGVTSLRDAVRAQEAQMSAEAERIVDL